MVLRLGSRVRLAATDATKIATGIGLSRPLDGVDRELSGGHDAIQTEQRSYPATGPCARRRKSRGTAIGSTIPIQTPLRDAPPGASSAT